jgi:hypothetical protein
MLGDILLLQAAGFTRVAQSPAQFLLSDCHVVVPSQLDQRERSDAAKVEGQVRSPAGEKTDQRTADETNQHVADAIKGSEERVDRDVLETTESSRFLSKPSLPGIDSSTRKPGQDARDGGRMPDSAVKGRGRRVDPIRTQAADGSTERPTGNFGKVLQTIQFICFMSSN